MRLDRAILRKLPCLRNELARALLATVVAASCLALLANGQSAVLANSHAKLELIADDTPTAGASFWAGVLFHLDPGWHVYWQNAGDSGTPPKIDWQLPAGYRIGSIRWPTPVRLGHGSVVDYGYKRGVLLMAPIERTSKAAQIQPSSIVADVKYVVCREVCIPGKAHLTLPLTADGGPSRYASHWRAIFEHTRAQFPKAMPSTWKLSATSNKDDFVLSIDTGTPVKNAAFFPTDSSVIKNSAPQRLTSTAHGFRLTLRKSDLLTQPVTDLEGLIVLGPQRAFEIVAPVGTR